MVQELLYYTAFVVAAFHFALQVINRGNGCATGRWTIRKKKNNHLGENALLLLNRKLIYVGKSLGVDKIVVRLCVEISDSATT